MERWPLVAGIGVRSCFYCGHRDRSLTDEQSLLLLYD